MCVCQLEEGVEGLVHVTEMSWTRITKPGGFLMGDEVDAVVLGIRGRSENFIGLRQLDVNPWDMAIIIIHQVLVCAAKFKILHRGALLN